MSRSIVDTHTEWLRLIESEGQFLTLPVLRQAFQSGLDSIKPSVRDALRKRYPQGSEPSQPQWDSWTDWLLRDVLEWGPLFRTGEDAASYSHALPEHGIVLHASAVLLKDDVPRALIVRYPHGTALDRRLSGERWNASPIDRLRVLCKAHGVRFGVLTDGERIVVAWIPSVGPGGYATWETALFLESKERALFQSFVSLFRASRFFAVQKDVQIEALFEASEKAQSEVTNQLGFQIRQAVELLVNAISRSNLERDGKLLSGIPPQRVYEAAVTVMMRLVFLLYAEERDLLPLSEPLYADFYAASTLREQLDEQASLEGDEPLERRGAAWNRLLATFRVIYAGLNHDRLRLPPYGGRLFDPDRFPFLEGRTDEQNWKDSSSQPLPIDDLTIRAILEAIQTLPIRESGSNERRRLSFRSLDVEQIGHVYEGLLDHGAERVDEVYVGLVGKVGDEAEIPLADIEAAVEKSSNQLVSLLVEKTKRSEGAVQKLLSLGSDLAKGKDPEARRLLYTACDNDTALATRLTPFAYALRTDLHGLPVIFKPGTLVVKQTRARRDSGTEYTPRELAEEMVEYALAPLVYSPGPRDGAKRSEWKLRPATSIANLKVCDPAVGSGAFLVSACRYLADRLVEAWIEEDPQKINENRDDLTLEARRLVADHCLYGVDRDSMAVEMAKLSLWLITMAKERPFSFLDHVIREGDSLLGITSIEQLNFLHILPLAGATVHAKTLTDITARVKPAISKAQNVLREMSDLPNLTIRDSERKRILSEDARQQLRNLFVVSDGLIVTAVANITETASHLDKAFQGYASLVDAMLNASGSPESWDEALERLSSKNRRLMNSDVEGLTTPRVPIHWPLAFPEVFTEERGGFDAIIGNPPFLGNRMWKSAYGESLQRIVHVVLGMPPGKVDLCAAFHRRAIDLLRNDGNYALLGTSNIAEGSAITVGLGQVVEYGDIFLSRKGLPWPNKAAVFVAIVCFHKGTWSGIRDADGKHCKRIGARLLAEASDLWQPKSLQNSVSAFQGVDNSKGLAFIVSPGDSWFDRLKSEPSSLLRPYITGDDITSTALKQPGRWALDIAARDLEEIKHGWPESFRFLRDVVKATRTPSELKSYPGLYERWWQFWNTRANLMRQLRRDKYFIAYSRNTKYPVCMLAPCKWIYTNKVLLLTVSRSDLFAICLSSFFQSWLEKYPGGNLGETPSISISKSLNTFPLPTSSVAQSGVDAAQRFNEVLIRWASDRHLGLTAAINAMHSPENNDSEIAELRQLAQVIDDSVCAAYGWKGLDVTHSFITNKSGARWSIDEASRNDGLDRMLQLNENLYNLGTGRSLQQRKQGRRSVSKATLGDARQISLVGERA